MDISIQSSGTVNLSTPAYNPQTQTYSSSVPVSAVSRTFHVEMGYDLNGSTILNLFPQPTGQDPNVANISSISVIRYANGQVTPFDKNGNAISVAVPNANMAGLLPFNLPGLASGTPIIGSLVISNIQAYAQASGLALTLNGATAHVARAQTAGRLVDWQYTQQGSSWVASGMTTTTSDSSGTSSRQIQVANVIYSDNRSADAARMAGGVTIPFTYHASTPSTPSGMARIALPQSSSSAGTSTVQNFAGSQNVLFQHGFLSSGLTWGRMTDWLNRDYIFGNEVVTSLSATAPLSAQGQNLESLIQAAGGNQYILIGHSQGGLVSRYAGQYFQTQPNGVNNTVRGVISVDTPHQGAYLTIGGPSTIASVSESLALKLFGQFGCLSPYDNDACYIAALIYFGIDGVAQLAISSVGALNDLTPGSFFLNQLNSGAETFQQAAVIGKTPQRWLVTRVADNFITGSPNPEAAFGERNIADITEVVYDVILGDFFIQAFTQEPMWFDYCYYEGGIDNGDPYCDENYPAEAALWDAQILDTMDKVDSYYNQSIAPPGDGSDGFVQNSSQRYPSPTAVQYTINGADSHTSAVRSDFDHQALDYLLTNVYQVLTPGSCSFSTNISQISAPVSGGSFSFSLNTSQGCPWSAVSQSPWLSIAPGSASGTSSAVVAFDVQPLATSVPRNGTIQVGYGSTTISVTVLELSSCSYSLSAGPQLTFSLSGGTTTVQVVTQTGCVWAASSNQSWLTVQNGSGTGNGSFTLTAAPSAPASAQPAIINVMGQIISVTEQQQYSCCHPIPPGGGPPH